MANRTRKIRSNVRFYFIFLGSKIPVNSYCSSEIKRMLLLWKKAMMNLGRLLKNRDLILLVKVSILKDMFFQQSCRGVRVGPWRSLSGKELMFQIVVLKKILGSPMDYKKIKPVNPERNQFWLFVGRTDAELKLQYFGRLMRRANSLEKTLMLRKIEGKRRGKQRIRWLDSIINWMDRNLSKLCKIWTVEPSMLQSMPSQSGSWLSDWRTATSPLKEFVFYIGKTCRYCKNFSRLVTWPDCFKRVKCNYCIENIFRFAKDRAGRLREYCSRGMILLICQNTEYL